MTPRFGFLRRTALGLALGTGLTAACAVEPTPAVDPSTVEQPVLAETPRRAQFDDLHARPADQRLWADPAPIEDSLARLEALEVLDVTDLVDTRTAHSWIPYGGFWSDFEVEMDDREIAARLERFVDVAEEAVASTETIPTDHESLCWSLGGDGFCLTKTAHAEDLAALNDLEIVEVAGVVRDHAQVDGLCYSSWETVSETVCRRAMAARAIVEATAEFENRRPPEGAGD